MTRNNRFRLHLERLELRDVPAVAVVNPTTATYTDVDGDHVTVKVSTGTLTSGHFATAASGTGEQLQLFDVSAGGFDGANITISVARVPGGDGLANVGYINSSLHDLGAVTVKGDLGRIDAGDAVTTTPGLKSLSVRSLGRLGTDTQMGVGSRQSNITGALGALKVAGDVKDVLVNVVGGADGKIGAISIGGSLIGGSNTDFGQIRSSGDMAAVKIGHDVQGGSGDFSGRIDSGGKLTGVRIGGSIIGGAGSGSGSIFSGGTLGAAKIGHDLLGGSGSSSGQIGASGTLASVSIGGSVVGGSSNGSGGIFSVHDLGVVKIAHDLIGDNITGSASVDASGFIKSDFGRIASVTIGGSIIAGLDTSSGALTNNASIRAANDIGSVTVKGSLIGNAGNGTPGSFSPVIISARGQEFPDPGVDLAIGRLTIGGRVEFASILAGYSGVLNPLNGDAQIGAVKVGGDWAASNVVAGAMNAFSGNTRFGDANDASIGAGSAGIIAKIASITIAGQVFGTPLTVSIADHYGFVAEQIGSLKIGGNAIALAANGHNDNLSVGATSDMTAHEV